MRLCCLIYYPTLRYMRVDLMYGLQGSQGPILQNPVKEARIATLGFKGLRHLRRLLLLEVSEHHDPGLCNVGLEGLGRFRGFEVWGLKVQ